MKVGLPVVPTKTVSETFLAEGLPFVPVLLAQEVVVARRGPRLAAAAVLRQSVVPPA